MDTWPGWKATFDVASSLAVSQGGAAGMEGEVSRIAAWDATRTCYFGARSMTYDTVRSVRNVPVGSHYPRFTPYTRVAYNETKKISIEVAPAR